MSAAHRLSGYTVSEIARRTSDAEIALAEEAVRRLAGEMESRGVSASSYIYQAVPAGVYTEGNHCVVDRKQAYRYELEAMQDLAAVHAVFSDPWNTLLRWARESNNVKVLKGVQADVDSMRNDHDSLKKGTLYKITYGKLCAAKKADRKMPDLFVRRMALIGEYARRRNALKMMKLAVAAGQSFMAAYTDSLLLRGVDAEATATSMSDTANGLVLKVESRAKVVVLAKINTHLFVLEDGAVLTRPHEMFGEELSRSGLSPDALAEFKDAVVGALSTRNYTWMREVYDQIPAELEMLSAAGKSGLREPSVRRLLGHVLSIDHSSPSRKRKRGATSSSFYGKLGDAKRAQAAVQEACFVVGEDRAGSKGLYRRWSLLRPSELVRCLGKPCHMTFVGQRVAYRVVVDYDEPEPLDDADVEACAQSIAQFWQNRKQLSVKVQPLRTKTRRQGAKSHSEHIVFVALDEATGKECVLLNPEEIPLAIGVSIKVDHLIYKLGKSLRLAGCPKLSADGASSQESVHLPKECVESDVHWTPDGSSYSLWCPCVILNDSLITHCDAPPAHDQSTARERCPFLFESETMLADAFVRWWDSLCESDYDYDVPKMFYWNKNKASDPDCNSFIMTVIFKSKTSKSKTFLDYADFAKRVAVPQLKNGFANNTAAQCKHHGSNHSYFVFKIDTDSAYSKGEIRGVNANTHHDKLKKHQASKPSDYGTYMALDDASKRSIVGDQGRQEYETALEAERSAKLNVTLARKSEYDAECRQVNAYRVRLALLRRHRAHQPGRQFPTTGRRDGWTEKSNSSHEDTVISVSALMQVAPKAVALRAVYTELKYYKTHLKGKRADYVVEALETLRNSSERPGYWEARQVAQAAVWEVVVRYGDKVTYRNEVY